MDEVNMILGELARHALVLQPASAVAAPDLGDQFRWNLLATRGDLVLVPGDKPLVAAINVPDPVIWSQQFFAELQH